jgi:formate dehydrogenase major subunit
MTNSWNDIKNTDLVIVMGGNAAEAHPVGFKWVIEAMHTRGTKLISIDPRFNRTSAVADLYVPLRNGTDIPFLGGIINWLLTNDKIHHDYVKFNTDATFLLKPDFKFDGGFFSGYNEATRSYDKSTWGYQLGADGYVKVDDSLQDPLCVYQQLKKHYSRYTPEMVEKVCGTPKDKFLKVCEMLGPMSAPDKTSTILYALGWTQHSVGSQNIRTMAMIQLLLGNMGRPGGGVNALRGHSNVQGVTDMNAYAEVFSGYLNAPMDTDTSYQSYVKRNTPVALRPNQFNYWNNFSKFWVSLMKSYYGPAATKENNWCFDWVPKFPGGYDVMHIFELMHQGKMHGFLTQGFNPLATVPNKNKLSAALMKLKYLVSIDPLNTETAEFWKNSGKANDVKPEDIQTEVFRLPAGADAEEEGTFTNSSRVLIWKERALPPPGEGKVDSEIVARLFLKLRELYAKEKGAFPDGLQHLTWDYVIPEVPSADELLKEYSGKAVSDIAAPADPAHPDAAPKLLYKKGQQLAGFASLKDDGSTSCGNWLYCGAWSEEGNLTKRRSLEDPSGLGVYQHFGYSWPANRRIMYNRASADKNGKPWAENKKYVWWDGKKWTGYDVPDMKLDAAPDIGMGSFIMTAEGIAHLHAVAMVDGPFPEHYEPFESPIEKNLFHPDNPKAKNNPCARVFKSDMDAFGKPSEFPYTATTYRLTEHFHYWTSHSLLNAIVQPAQFIEISEELAKEKGIKKGDQVKVKSNRGEIVAAAVVTKRIKPFIIDGKPVHLVGVPILWGYTGVTKHGYIANALTPFVGDPNVQTPEFKAFLVNIEKV